MTTPESNSSDLWIFGYGSLMWRPGFAHAEAAPARLWGWHRALCIYSTHYRGTPENPGLVMGLAPGGSCRGMAFRVEPDLREATLAYLREREMRNKVYRELFCKVSLADGSARRIQALAYVADPTHRQYASGLSEAQRLALVATSHGEVGSNRDYVLATQELLEAMGTRDRALSRFAEALKAL